MFHVKQRMQITMTVIDVATKQVRNCAISKQRQQNLQVKRECIFVSAVENGNGKSIKRKQKGEFESLLGGAERRRIKYN